MLVNTFILPHMPEGVLLFGTMRVQLREAVVIHNRISFQTDDGENSRVGEA
jgi:hypothetical protein